MRFRSTMPFQSWLGLLLIAVAWPLNWMLDGVRTHLLFFPLWLGYILLVDGMVLGRSGSSMLRRSKTGFLLLFLASSAVWWLLELINLRTGNWLYDGRELFSDLEYVALASLSFSTVIPAVFETADLWRSMDWTKIVTDRRRISVTPRLLAAWFATGSVMLALVLIVPRVAYPFTWVCLLLIFEPLAYRWRNDSLLHHLSRGDWRPLLVLPLGALTCGLFWEMWNCWSYPKWIYDTPGFNYLHIFEMPLLGYLGYLPFGLELFPMTYLLLGTRASKTIGWNR